MKPNTRPLPAPVTQVLGKSRIKKKKNIVKSAENLSFIIKIPS